MDELFGDVNRPTIIIDMGMRCHIEKNVGHIFVVGEKLLAAYGVYRSGGGLSLDKGLFFHIGYMACALLMSYFYIMTIS